jgi:hypothetical protein
MRLEAGVLETLEAGGWRRLEVRGLRAVVGG